MTKIDLHVHSRFSDQPAHFLLQYIGCPESFTEPMTIYHRAKERGMDLVTITDHNRIEGALQIAHLPDVIIGEEVTARFPEDGCKVHVLVYGIDEARHRDIQDLRANLYELVAYLVGQRIVHALAHPLYAVNDRLTRAHFEKLLLLFNVFEINGARNDRENQRLKRIMAGLDAATMEKLADTHRLPMRIDPCWEKALIGGSDDHSSLSIARTHTVIPGMPDRATILQRIRSRQIVVATQPASPLIMAHNLCGIAWQFQRSWSGQNRDPVAGAVDALLLGDRCPEKDAGSLPAAPAGPPAAGTDRLGERIHRLAAELLAGGGGDQAHPWQEVDAAPEHRWFAFTNDLMVRLWHQVGKDISARLSSGQLFDVFSVLGSGLGICTLAAPYLLSYYYFTKDRSFSHEVAKEFEKDPQDNKPTGSSKVAHFTDTYSEVNGVALTIQQQVCQANRHGKDLTAIVCEPAGDEPPEGLRRFAPLAETALPAYPELKLRCPPFLEMLDYCYTQRFTHIHTATPGPVGLAGLAIARILNLPVTGTYHTQIPQYAEVLTGDPGLAGFVERAVLWFYRQLDWVQVPSESTRRELAAKGLSPQKLRLYPRGVDIDRFTPAKRNGMLKKRYNIDKVIKLLYVGRVSDEKNLPLLADVFLQLAAQRTDIHLIVVGDGPYRQRMQSRLSHTPCTFTGYLQGEDLAEVYASSDILVFPSATDTFGNVVLEAQASGIPVIVSDQGGPVENVLPGATGLVVPAGDAHALDAAIRTLADAPRQIRAMGRKARAYMEGRSFDQAFVQAWQMFETPPAASPMFQRETPVSPTASLS